MKIVKDNKISKRKLKTRKFSLLLLAPILGITSLSVAGCFSNYQKSDNVLDPSIDNDVLDKPNNNEEKDESKNDSLPLTPLQPATPVEPEKEPDVPLTPLLPPIINNQKPVIPQPPIKDDTDNIDSDVSLMEFKVKVTRTSGFMFNDNNRPYFFIYNSKGQKIDIKSIFDTSMGISDSDDGEKDGYLSFSLPENDTYTIKIAKEGWGFQAKTYRYPEEVKVNKLNPIADFIFEPIIEESPKEGFYNKEDVVHEFEFKTDVLNNPISLKTNKENGKMTILMYMRTKCPYSLRTLNALYQSIYLDELNQTTNEKASKVQVLCFSNADSINSLETFQKERFPEFHFIHDPNNIMVDQFFPNNRGYPRMAVLDYEGVYIRGITGEVGKHTFDSIIPKYAK